MTFIVEFFGGLIMLIIVLIGFVFLMGCAFTGFIAIVRSLFNKLTR